MKVLITFPKTRLSGANRIGLSYVQELVSAGHQVLAIPNDNWEGGRSPNIVELEKLDVDIVCTFRFNIKTTPGFMKALKRIKSDYSPDLCVSLCQEDVKYGALISRYLAIPFVSVQQNLRIFHGSRGISRLKAALYGYVIRNFPDHVVCVSSAVFKEHVGRFRVANSKAVLNRNGIDLESYESTSPLNVEQQRLISGIKQDGRKIMVVVGRLSEQKGVDIAIKAMKILSEAGSGQDCALLVVGDAPPGESEYKQFLEKTALENGVREKVHFMGWQTNPRAFMAEADICVQPSRWEGLPLTVLEALLSNGVCVYTDCTGPTLDELDENNCGLRIVETGSERAIANAVVETLTTDVELLESMRASSKRLVRAHYDMDVAKKKFVSFLENLVL